MFITHKLEAHGLWSSTGLHYMALFGPNTLYLLYVCSLHSPEGTYFWRFALQCTVFKINCNVIPTITKGVVRYYLTFYNTFPPYWHIDRDLRPGWYHSPALSVCNHQLSSVIITTETKYPDRIYTDYSWRKVLLIIIVTPQPIHMINVQLVYKHIYVHW